MSRVALQRAAQRAAEAGDEIAGRITWQQRDLMTWEPAALQFDLVSAQFMYLPPGSLESLHRRLAAAVRPGGSLLIVGHHPSDMETSIPRPNHRELYYTAEEVAGRLDPSEWEIVVLATPARETVDPDGQAVTIHDTVLRAVRR